jgi:hypothetical protein
MNPEWGPPTPEEGRARLETAARELERTVQHLGGIASSKVFGAVPVSDYIRFQELHTRHHRAQLPVA